MGSPNFFALGLNRSLTPPDGVKCTNPIPLRLTGGVSLSLDLRAAQINDNLLSACQSMYIDNSGNPLPVEFLFASGQVLKVPDHCQGYFNVLMPNPIQFSAVCAADWNLTVMLLNLQVPPIFWTA